jgi:alkylation response protein AidB-like acyl-CoA dehydrogenase
MDALLARLVAGDATLAGDDLAAWWRACEPLRARCAHPVERAMALSLVAPTVGSAFVAGYRAALHALDPSLGPHTRAALCASEEGGAHPRAVNTRATVTSDGVTLDGTKRFVTGARDADVLLVLAAEGEPVDGRRAFALVRVPASAPGVTFEDMPATPFVPDVAHATVTFEGVRLAAAARLAGDGWSEYVKPFRTLEDLHVQAAITAWLVGALRRARGPGALIERLVAHALTLRALADATVDAAATHVALAGAFANLEGLLGALDGWMAQAPDDLRDAWARDRRVLTVARSAREQRRVRAWERVSDAVQFAREG